MRRNIIRGGVPPDIRTLLEFGDLEPETLAYMALSSPSIDIVTVNNYVRSVKYGSGVTLTSQTLNISKVASYYFLTNPLTDLRWATGFYLTLTDTSGYTKKVLLGAVGTGETLDVDIVTTSWTNNAASFNIAFVSPDQTITSAISGSTGQATHAAATTLGALYKTVLTRTVNAGTIRVYSVDADINGNNAVDHDYLASGTYYATAKIGGARYVSIYGTGGFNFSLDSYSFKKVLSPSLQGIWYTPVSEDYLFNPNSATFTVKIEATNTYQAETTTQGARILADGGVVISWAWMDSVIATMKAQSIYTSAKFIGDANIAYKDGGSGAVATLYDVSGNNNDFTATGIAQPIWTANKQNGKYGLVFNGTTNRLGVTFAANYLAGDFTFDFLIRYTTLRNYITAFDNSRGATGFSVGTQAVGALIWYSSAAEQLRSADGAILNTTHYKTTFLRSGTLLTGYLNGTSACSNTVTTNFSDLTFTIGALASGSYSEYFVGDFEYLFLYNVALTPTQQAAMTALVQAYYAIY